MGKHLEVYTKWAAIEDHRIGLIGECPGASYPECSTQGVCWDGSIREDDDLCSCPLYLATQCPSTVCLEHQVYDDMACLCSWVTAPLPEEAVVEEAKVIESEIVDEVVEVAEEVVEEVKEEV